MATVSISQAAQALGIHPNTVRRRLNKGELTGYLHDQKWLIKLPDEVVSNPGQDVNKVKWLETQLGSALSTIREQNELITRLTERALPAPRLPWWRSLLRR